MTRLVFLFLLSVGVCCNAQNTFYYKLTRIQQNGIDERNLTGGQFITFSGNMCYESNNKGLSVGHGALKLNHSYSNSQYFVYQGSSYWGKDATFKFNADKSVLNVILDNSDIYVYKKATAPVGQETCSLIRKSGGGGGGSNVVIPPTPIVIDPNTPTPSPTPTPTPTPAPTPTPQPKQHKCGLCGGSGEVIENNATSFGNTKYCSKCGKTVPDSHYHTICPSCKGTGWW